MKRSFTVFVAVLLLAACTSRPGFIPIEAVEAAVAPTCLMQCRQMDMTCRAGCLHDWQCVSNVCHGPYRDCLYGCPITNYAVIEPWVKPKMSCGRLPADRGRRARALTAMVNSGEITWADYYRCIDPPGTVQQ